MTLSFRARLFGVLLLVGGTAACHHDALPPLDGTYVFPDGQEALFSDGTFVGNALFGTGDYTVSGTHVVLRMKNGARLEGERLDAEHIRLAQKDGHPIPPFDLYRAGTAGALEGKRALAARTGHAVPTDAEQDARAAAERKALDESVFVPDADTPLANYTALDTALDDAIVRAAFTVPAMTDAQLLGALVPGYAHEADAFKRKDLADSHLPALKARIAQARAQHYYSIPVQVQAPADFQASYVQASIAPYDLAQKAFPIEVIGKVCLGNAISAVFGFSRARFACAFPVSDETVARRLEAARAADPIHVTVEGRVYFCVTRAAPIGYSIPAEALHARLHMVGIADPSLQVERDL